MRNGSLDLMRLPAAFGVVLFHVGAPGAMIGYSGLAYFLILVPAFGLASSASAQASGFVRSRARRLLVPWLIWSGIFALLRLGLWQASHRPFEEVFDPSMIVTGASLHLWFLPYAFFASLCLPSIRRLATGLSRPAFLALVSATLLLLLASLAPILHRQPDPPLAQWAYGLPSLLAGLALGLVRLRQEGAMAVNLSLAAVLGFAVLIGWTDGVLQLTVALLAILACMALPSPDGPLATFCARHSMGVYLVHPLCMSALIRIVPLEHDGLPMAVLVMLASLGLSVLFGRFRSTHPLIGDMA